MSHCFAFGCNHRVLKDTCKFYRFPKEKRTFKLWADMSRRKDRKPNINDRLCSCHFLNGEKCNGPTIFPRNEDKAFQFKSPEKRTRKKRATSGDEGTQSSERPQSSEGPQSMGKSLVRNNGVTKTSSTANNVVPTRHLVEINQISNENTSSAIEDGVDPLPLNHPNTYLKSDDEYDEYDDDDDDDDDEMDFEENERLNIPNLQVKSEPGSSSDSTNCTDVIVKIEPDSKSSMHEIKLDIKNDETELLFYCFAQSVKKLSPYYHEMAKTEVAALLSRIELINSTDPR